MRPASETITASSVSQPRSPSGRGSRPYLCNNRGRSPEHFEEGAGHPSGPAAGPAEVPAKVTNPRLSTFVPVPRSALPDGPWLRSGGHLSPRSKASAKNQLWGRVGGGRWPAPIPVGRRCSGHLFQPLERQLWLRKARVPAAAARAAWRWRSSAARGPAGPGPPGCWAGAEVAGLPFIASFGAGWGECQPKRDTTTASSTLLIHVFFRIPPGVAHLASCSKPR